MTLTVERLKELLVYDEETGTFSWRRLVRGSRGRVGCYDRYTRIRIDRKLYYAHRLAWLYTYGRWPRMIDHIDGDKTNNKISNLRPSTARLNQFNRKIPPKGMYLQKGKWRVQIGRGIYHKRHVGIFDTKAEARAARQRIIGG